MRLAPLGAAAVPLLVVLFTFLPGPDASLGAAPAPTGEIVPAGWDPGPNSLAGPLDGWGDWLRGASQWRFDRRVLPTGGPAGQRAVRTEIHPADPRAAESRGWMVTGFIVDGAEWAGFRGLRFFCRTDRPGRVRLVLYATDSVWHMDQVLAKTTLDTTTNWTLYTLTPNELHTGDSPMPDWCRVRTVGWVVEGEPNAIEIATFRVLLDDTAARRVRAARLGRRLRQLRLDTRSLAGRGLFPPCLKASADTIENRLAASRPASAAVLDAVARDLEQAERLRAAADTLFSIRQRLAHYRDLLAVPELQEEADAALLSRQCADLDHRRRALAREMRAVETLPAESPALESSISDLESRCNDLWRQLRKKTAADPARFRPTVQGSWWQRPGGRPIVPLAAHNLYTIYGNEKGWRQAREADYRLLSTWGFNATRVHVHYALLEPEPGRFDPAYLARIHHVIDWADKYGIYAVIDIHWPYPDWFYKGPTSHPCPHREEQNPYHQPEALVSTFRHLARELSVHPNILAWEAPTNEPAISSIEIWPKPENDPTIADIPALMMSWNQWLRQKYHTRALLDRTWRDTPHMPDQNGLGPEESWENDTILPPGKRGVPAPWNRRLYDYLQWAVSHHTELCGRIAAAIRESIPGAVLQQQPLAGGRRWERDPIPVIFFPWQQHHVPGVQVGTHYGVGHACAWISPLHMPSMNSEERTEWRQGIFARQRARNQGATAFMYFPRNGFINSAFRLKPSTAWLAAVTEFWDRAPCRAEYPILVVVNSRLGALQTGQDGSAIVPMLEQLGLGYEVAGSAYVAATPSLVQRYRAITMSLDYADPACIEIIRKAGVPAWFFGCPGPDIRAGFGPNSIPAHLARMQCFLKTTTDTNALSSRENANPDYLDLSGTWRFRTDPDDTGKRHGWWTVDLDDQAWDEQAVPAYWENIGVLHKGRAYDGVAWYRHHLRLPPAWAGQKLWLEFGGIDDLDETYVNGKLVGSTDENTPHYWEAFRHYPVAANLLHADRDNVIAVRVRDLRGNGGIWRAPVRLRLAQPRRIRVTTAFGKGLFHPGDELSANVSRRMPRITRSMLNPETRVLAEFTSRAADTSNRPVALLRQGSCWLWLGTDTLDSQRDEARKLLAGFLRQNNLAVDYPPPAALDGVSIYPFAPSWIAVVNESRQPRTVVLPTKNLLTDLEGYPLAQTILPSGHVQVRVRGDHPSSALFLRRHAPRLQPAAGKTILVSTFEERELPGATDIALTTQSDGPAVLHLPAFPAGGTMIIDGVRHPIPPSKTPSVPLPAGKHQVRVKRIDSPVPKQHP